MANCKSAKKNILINERNRQRNVAYKSRMKTWIKKAQSSMETQSDDQEAILRTALKIIDKTASKGIIKQTTASRKKSRLTLAFNKANMQK